jgi:hypothetical protein
LAARYGHLIVVEMLLAAGTAIHGSLLAALQSGHEEISGILLRMTDQVGSVELLAAAKCCSPSLMCELIKKASKIGMIDIVRAIYEAKLTSNSVTADVLLDAIISQKCPPLFMWTKAIHETIK